MTPRAYYVIGLGGDDGYAVVTVRAGMGRLRPLPVVVVAGPFPTRCDAQGVADAMDGERDAALGIVRPS